MFLITFFPLNVTYKQVLASVLYATDKECRRYCNSSYGQIASVIRQLSPGGWEPAFAIYRVFYVY